MKLQTLPLYQPSKEIKSGIFRTKLAELFFIQSQKHRDDRGYFSEVVRLPELNQVIKQPFKPAQINHAKNKRNVIKGFHAENWNKLVTIPNGVSLNVLLDVRKNSPTFGQYEAILMGDDAEFPQAIYGALYIPAGIANSVLVLSQTINYFYFFDQLYKNRDARFDVAISLFDPDVNFPWPITKEKMIISERDKKAVTLKSLSTG